MVALQSYLNFVRLIFEVKDRSLDDTSCQRRSLGLLLFWLIRIEVNDQHKCF